MTLDAIMMLTGALTVILPYLGFPSMWDRPLYTLFGILFIIFGIILRRRGGRSSSVDFVESNPSQLRDMTRAPESPDLHDRS